MDSSAHTAPVDSEIVTENLVAALSEIITENVSRADSSAHVALVDTERVKEN
jgi:hypothetical protein